MEAGNIEAARAAIRSGRPRSVERARKLLEKQGFEFTGPRTFKAGAVTYGVHEFEIGPDPLSETGFSIERKG